MGVQGLWDLLAPVGRRVSVETLAGKRLAIDASIWMIQFMKAMRDERGEMVRNAHLLGFFRRICKLLFLRTKPVFVFDGGTPALKRRTVIARRRQRENAQAKIRKTAEKLLINHLKSLRLKALAEELKNQKVKDNSKGKAIMQEQASTLETNDVSGSPNQEAIDEMLAASLAAEELGDFNGGSSTSASVGGNFDGTASTSAASFLPDDEDDEDDEEMILPITNGNVDPAVLASLPPSMQLDLLVQMRERLMAENRQKYQKVTKAPQKFSELQIEAYLKTVAFRREIDQVQKAASGRGVDGVQTSRIASEANREFIFSSSFTGDKQLLTERGAEQQGQKEHSFVNLARDITPAARSSSEAAPSADEHLRRIDDDVQTFLDERGRMRLSRRRAMGMRMTGDLERNIELMKELENNQAVTNDGTNGQVNLDESMISASGPGDNHGQSQPLAMEEQVCGGTIQSNTANSLSEGENHRDTPTGNIGTSIEISFGDNREQGTFDDDDELFASLVAGNQLRTPSADNSLQNKTDSSLECEWEEGTIGDTTNDNKSEERLCVGDDGDDEVEIEWEEGERDIHKDASSSLTDMKAVSKGALEEEAALQEAIRRSLEDLDGKRSDPSHELKRCVKTFQEPFQRDSNSAGTSLGMGNDLLDGRPSHTSGSESMDSDCVVGKNLDIADFSGTASMLCGEVPAIADIDMISPGETNEYSYKQQVKASDDSAEIVVSAANGSRVHSHISSDATDSPAVAISHGSEAVPVSYSEKASDITVREGEMSLKESSSNTNFSGDVTKEYGFHMLQPGESTELITERDGVDDVEVTGADVEDELLKLSQEYKNLGDEQRKLERNAESVESEMFVGCQELLQMFGLPYIIAPMEAEAQCAYMELENLVDGVVTDDSDVFLFGARSVYKNIFDDRKYVETYFVKDIENELGLDREKLIGMALLLGSDYTEGISGIGIVNAIEVVTAFPEHDGLQQFRKWVESPDPTILGTLGMRRGLSSKEKGTKSTDNCTSSKNEMEDTLQENEDDQAMDIKQTFMDKHRNVSKNWHIPSSFPSEIVISAYQSPQVDKSTEPFSWGKPDLFSLRRLCWEKFGWSSQKADELLVPVLKEYNKHETQLRLEAFYSFNERFAKIRSKRIKQALKGVSGNQSSGLADSDASQEGPQNMRKRKLSTTDNKRTRKKSLRGKSSAENLKQRRKRNDQNERLSSGEGNEQPSGQAEERVLESKEREGRGKRIARGVGRGQRKKSRGSELDETSGSDDRSTSNDEYEAEGGEVQKSHVLRRSLRERKPANYVENDVGTNEPASFVNESVAVCAIGDVGRDHDDVRGAEDSIPMADAPVEADKGDYLHMGGGFCVEGETETNQDELEHVTSTKSTSLPVDDFVDIDVAEHPKDNTNRGGTGSDEVEVEMRHISISESSNLLENGQGESRTSINALSAMPNLRRKRRKGG